MYSQKKWTEEEDWYIEYAYRDRSVTQEEMAEFLGVSRRQLGVRIKRLGLESPKKWREEDNKRLKALYQTNNASEVAEEMDRSKWAIEKQVKKLGLHKQKSVMDKAQTIRELAGQRKTLKEISSILGVNYPALWDFCKRENIKVVNQERPHQRHSFRVGRFQSE